MEINSENIDFDVAAAIKQRRIYQLLGFGIGFTLLFIPVAILNSKIVVGLISGTVVGLFGYLIAVIILRCFRNQRLLSRMDDASIKAFVISTPTRKCNGIDNLSLPQALGAIGGIVVVAFLMFLMQTSFDSGAVSDTAKLHTYSKLIVGRWACGDKGQIDTYDSIGQYTTYSPGDPNNEAPIAQGETRVLGTYSLKGNKIDIHVTEVQNAVYLSIAGSSRSNQISHTIIEKLDRSTFNNKWWLEKFPNIIHNAHCVRLGS